jgi:hypothetical protein
MDVIEFRIAAEDGGDEAEPSPTIHPIVNGTPLRELAKVVEQPYADARHVVRRRRHNAPGLRLR